MRAIKSGGVAEGLGVYCMYQVPVSNQTLFSLFVIVIFPADFQIFRFGNLDLFVTDCGYQVRMSSLKEAPQTLPGGLVRQSVTSAKDFHRKDFHTSLERSQQRLDFQL